MTLHLVKLAVGVESIEDIAKLQKRRVAEARAAGRPAILRHLTRNVPRRADEIVDGGSIYWVIRGAIRARQRIVRFIDGDKTGDARGRAAIVLHRKLVEVEPRPMRAFQGWRYFEPADAPPDLDRSAAARLPPRLRAELRELGLL